jgi:large subunit ribosomal protein L24
MKNLTKHHIKIGDKIKILSGNQKGFVGIISSIIKKKSIAAIDGVLPRIKYIKNREGGEAKKVELLTYIHISNLMLWDNETNSASKIGYKIINSKKERYFKKSGNLLKKKE